MANALALDAVGDPGRRRILEVIGSGERSVREITDAVDITQSGVSQHLKVLRGAGLVDLRVEGRRHLYRVDLDGMAQVRAWVDGFWDDVLTAFADHVATDHPTGRSTEEDPR